MTTVEYLVMAGVLVAALLVVFQVFATQSRSAMDRLGNCIAGAAGGTDCSAGSDGFLDSVSRGARTAVRATSQYWNAVNRGARHVSNAASQYWNAINRGVRTVSNTATRYRNALNRGVQTVTDTTRRYWNATKNAVSQLGGG